MSYTAIDTAITDNVIQTCIDAWDWEDGVTVEYRGSEVGPIDVMGEVADVLQVKLVVDCPEGVDLDDLEEMLSALTDHLDSGGRIIGRIIAYTGPGRP